METVAGFIFQCTAPIAFLATIAVGVRLYAEAADPAVANALFGLGTMLLLLALLTVGLDSSELASLAFEFGMPVYAFLSVGLFWVLARHFCQGRDRGRMLLLGTLWLIAGCSLITKALYYLL